jgi:hypothetical protein
VDRLRRARGHRRSLAGGASTARHRRCAQQGGAVSGAPWRAARARKVAGRPPRPSVRGARRGGPGSARGAAEAVRPPRWPAAGSPREFDPAAARRPPRSVRGRPGWSGCGGATGERSRRTAARWCSHHGAPRPPIRPSVGAERDDGARGAAHAGAARRASGQGHLPEGQDRRRVPCTRESARPRRVGTVARPCVAQAASCAAPGSGRASGRAAWRSPMVAGRRPPRPSGWHRRWATSSVHGADGYGGSCDVPRRRRGSARVGAKCRRPGARQRTVAAAADPRPDSSAGPALTSSQRRSAARARTPQAAWLR